jgi:hypothetical protein
MMTAVKTLAAALDRRARIDAATAAQLPPVEFFVLTVDRNGPRKETIATRGYLPLVEWGHIGPMN